MKPPSCSVCQMTYNEEDRVPMMLQCGHSFCKECLSHMFSVSIDNTLPCPRCRQLSKVGNSVEGLRKNFAMISLLHHANENCTPEDESDEDDELNTECASNCNNLSNNGLGWPSTCGNGMVMDVGSHSMRLIRQLGKGPRPGQDSWSVLMTGPSGCRHKVAVKRIKVSEGMDLVWVQSRLENLRRASMWCQNVCTFYGACEKEGKLCMVMDKYMSSVQAEMQQNEGRLTLEQILRYGADISRGVAELHAAGVACMNLKPSNLLLDAKGRAVVSDFGLPEILKKPQCRKARSLTEDETTRTHSCVDCTMLNPHYTAPEAWEPLKKSSLNIFWDDGSGISAESDAWSFGCTLVEMCTGAIPWAGLSSEEIYRAVVKARRQPPQYASVVGVGIPRELWKMIGECLQFKPSKRPTFNAMLSIFLRHLQEIPLSPPASPENDPSKDSEATGTEPSPSSVLDFAQDTPNALHRMVSEGDVEGVRDLLARASSGKSGCSIGALLEGRNAEGQTALHLACMRGYAELVESILECPEADVEVLDKDGDPPIVFALAAGTPDSLKALISRGANVNAKLKEGLGPSVAHVCAFHGQPDCMRELLLAGADPNAVDDEGETVLHRAVAKKHTDCAIVILENGGCSSMGILNSKELTPLHMCIATWNVAVVKKWVEVATIEEIQDAIEVPSKVGTALCMAAALKKAHETECRELVRILLAAGADPETQDLQRRQTALHAAAIANDVEMVKIILDAGVHVDVRDAHNTTPLHVALARGSKACVGLLLESGANCNLQDDEGDNAFHIAADTAKMVRENLDWIVVMLRQEDAAVDVRNHSGKTLKDFIEALPREWISEDLMDALLKKGIQLSMTIFDIGDWVKFKKNVKAPKYGWQGAKHKSVGFVQNVPDKDHLIVSFCSGEARVLQEEVFKVIPLDRGQHVQLKADVREPRYGWRGQSRDSIGTVLCVDDDGILRVGFPGASRGWKADPAEMERVEEFKVGDWVRIRPSLTSAKHGLGLVTPGSIGIVYCIRPDNSLLLDLNYMAGPWHCEPEEVEPVEPFKVGDRVCVKRSVAEPRYAWGGETHHSVGRISEIGSDGLLLIDIPGRPISWQADPSDMEKAEDFKVGDWVRVKASVSSPKYGWEDVTRSSVGIVHNLDEDGDMGVAFCFRSKPFSCSVTDMEKVAPFEVGDEIHIMSSVTEPRLGWSRETTATTGKIARIDMDGTLNVKVAGRSTLWKVAPGDAERLSGFEVGDWVRLKPTLGIRPSYDWHGIGKDSFAVVHSLSDTGYLELAGCFRKGRWMTHYTEVEKVPSLKIGQHVRFRPGLTEPRWGWRGASANSRGVIIGVHADGEVWVTFSGLSVPWRGDPADLEKEEMYEVGDWVKVRLDLVEPKNGWRSVRPGSIGIVQGIAYDNGDIGDRTILIGFCGEQERWLGLPHELERVEPFSAGQQLQVKSSVKQPRFGWSGHGHHSIGTITAIDADGRLRVHTFSCTQKAWMLDPAEVEVIEEQPICIGDWVRVKPSVPTPTHQWGEVTHKSIGVVHKIDDDGDLRVAFCFLDRLWVCKPSEMERVRPFKIENRVRVQRNVGSPRWGWGMETYASRGRIVGVDADGKLRIKFAWREGRLWVGDPADVELDSDVS
ncbi:E3 ubiquitin-protein ligase KEG isoform X2 [Cryptomeria japonica]|uniref:E3 ubiquitin-protein ligase KEG isoform X2 n=1 Tax=Cryptomeria japonica TaxID=3369 RepID=UPI0025AD73B1|nr:E3 ubiquitin-protein ligase KEG isoform X2 [Cryptomeria japonica]